MRLFHGTAGSHTDLTPYNDAWGLPEGVFFTEDWATATAFASAKGDEERVFTAEVDMTDALDMTEVFEAADDDQDTAVEMVTTAWEAAGYPSVILLPDWSGTGEEEILVTDTSAMTIVSIS